METFRQWWRRAKSELRYQVEQKMVWRELHRHPERCFVRFVVMARSGPRTPVIGPVNTGEDVAAALIHGFAVKGGHFRDTTDLMPLEQRLDVLFTTRTNFVDIWVHYNDGMLGVRIMPQPRLIKPPLPPVPDWNDPNQREWDIVSNDL